MRCPHCGHEENKVVDSRPSQDGHAVRRRRECLGCQKRFTTYEYVEHVALTIIKSDGRHEPYDRMKLLHGLKLACNKRPISSKQMESIADEVEAKLNSRFRSEISSKEVGELVMNKLRDTDEIAYVRFASVYRKFKDKSEFLDELRRLLGE